MVDLDRIPVDGGEDPTAGARGHGALCQVPRRRPPPAFLPDDQASLVQEPVNPVLGRGAGEAGALGDIRYREEPAVEGIATHQLEELAPPLKDARDSSP